MPFYKIVTWVTDPIEKKGLVEVRLSTQDEPPVVFDEGLTDNDGIRQIWRDDEIPWIAEVTDENWPGIDPELRDGPDTVEFFCHVYENKI